MDRKISRRRFLATGAAVLGAAAAGDLAGMSTARAGSAAPPTDIDPHIIVKLYPGRSEAQKKRLAEAIVRDVVSIIQCGEDSVSVSIEEISPAEWTEKVYKPDILNKEDKLYKKPGYRM
jgi:4-oxalocrotonate tautomerase